MRPSAFLHLLRANLFQRPWRLALTLFSLGAASFFLAAVLSASVGLPRTILARVEAAFPAKRLTALPPSMSMALLRIDGDISPEQADKIAALEGVEAVHRIAPLRVPISLRAEIVGNGLQTDSFVWGVPRGLVEEVLTEHVEFEHVPDWKAGGKVPAVVPGFFLDMFNTGFAEASGLPKLNKDAAVGRQFEMLLNTTTLTMARGERKTVQGVVAGVSSDASLLAVLMPLETVLEINEWNGGSSAKKAFLALKIDLADLGAYDRVAAKVEELGLRVEGNREIVASARYMTLGGAALLAAMGLIVASVAAISLFNTFAMLMMERRAQIGLFCAIGGSRGLLARLYLAETLAIAVAGAGTGSAAAWLLLVKGEAAVFASLPKLSFLPEKALWLSPMLPVLVTAGVAALCLVACLPPLLSASRRPPGEIVSSAAQ